MNFNILSSIYKNFLNNKEIEYSSSTPKNVIKGLLQNIGITTDTYIDELQELSSKTYINEIEKDREFSKKIIYNVKSFKSDNNIYKHSFVDIY